MKRDTHGADTKRKVIEKPCGTGIFAPSWQFPVRSLRGHQMQLLLLLGNQWEWNGWLGTYWSYVQLICAVITRDYVRIILAWFHWHFKNSIGSIGFRINIHIGVYETTELLCLKSPSHSIVIRANPHWLEQTLCAQIIIDLATWRISHSVNIILLHHITAD